MVVYIPSAQYSGSQGGSSLPVRATSAHYLSRRLLLTLSLSLFDSRMHLSHHPSTCISIAIISYSLSSVSHPLLASLLFALLYRRFPKSLHPRPISSRRHERCLRDRQCAKIRKRGGTIVITELEPRGIEIAK